MENQIRMFVDMDGTLTVFNQEKNIDVLFEKNYFLNQEPMQNMVEAIAKIASANMGIDVYVLTACLNSKYAKAEKNLWLDKYLPMIDQKHRIFCDYGTEKSRFIKNPKNNDVLLDDYTKNLISWHGIGIKVLNGINDTHKSWQGERINSFFESEFLSYTIRNNILQEISKQCYQR